MKAWATEFNKKLKPITEAQIAYHKRNSERYLFIKDKDGNCTCPKCNTELKLGKTKHKSKVVCPNCTNKLIVQHLWRASKHLEVINWMVIPKVVDNHTLVLRYVLAHQTYCNPMKVYEAARMFIDEYRAEAEYYCFVQDWKTKEMFWGRGKSPYFRIDCMLAQNKFWCANAYEYPRNFFKEINKLDCFKYYSAEKEYDFQSYSMQLFYMMRSARLNEKLYKVGMDSLANYHRNYFMWHRDRCYPQNYNATDLIGMLKLDKPRFNVLKEKPDSDILLFLQKHKDVNIPNFKLVDYDISKYNKLNDISYKTKVSFKKVNEYVKNVNMWEYSHYLGVLETLGYDIKDTYYSLPKDFRKADKRITKEYNEYLKEQERKRQEEEIQKASKKDELIKKISDGIKKMPNLAEFLNGSNGLLIYVPESARDLITEGKELHNCIGSYVDRIAEGDTLVFFVRRLNDPTAPFVAFEYFEGDVVQCRYDHNKTVEDTEILDFVNRFAEALKAA